MEDTAKETAHNPSVQPMSQKVLTCIVTQVCSGALQSSERLRQQQQQQRTTEFMVPTKSTPSKSRPEDKKLAWLDSAQGLYTRDCWSHIWPAAGADEGEKALHTGHYKVGESALLVFRP